MDLQPPGEHLRVLPAPAAAELPLSQARARLQILGEYLLWLLALAALGQGLPFQEPEQVISPLCYRPRPERSEPHPLTPGCRCLLCRHR